MSLAESLSSSKKREADAAESESPEAKRNCQIECGRCLRRGETTLCRIRSASGVDDVPLCAGCKGFRQQTTLVVLKKIDDDSGLPLLCNEGDQQASYLGKLLSREELGKMLQCRHCRSVDETVACCELRPAVHGRPKRYKGAQNYLCRQCRFCNNCGDLVEAGGGIDFGRGSATGCCVDCVVWCEHCECFHTVDSDDFQEAENADGGYVCVHECCGCQEASSALEHPSSDRWYCVECVLQGNRFSSETYGDDEDDDDWAELLKQAQAMKPADQ